MFPPGRQSLRPFAAWLARVAALAAAYCVTGKLGLLLAVPPGYATAVWPPSGLALAALLLWGNRVWPGVWLGSFLVNVATSYEPTDATSALRTLAVAASIAAGASLQALAGAVLVRRAVGFPTPLLRERDVLAFMALGGPVSCLVNATVGVTTLQAAGLIGAGEWFFSWWTWWVGDAIGVILCATLILVWVGRPREAWVRRRTAVVTPLGLMATGVIALFVYSSAREQGRVEGEFADRVDSGAERLARDITGYTEVLRAAGQFLTLSPEIDRRAFRAFGRDVIARHPGILALSWNPRVPAGRRDAFEQAARRDGLTGFEITEQDARGTPVRAGARAEYVPVLYIEPGETDAAAVGFDVTSAPLRGEALARARDGGTVAATGRVRLVQETRGESGLLLFFPVYGNGQAHGAPDERPAGLRGYAAGVFHLRHLVETSLKDMLRSGAELELIDEGPDGEEALLYSSAVPGDGAGAAAGPARPHKDKPVLERSHVLEVGGRRWVLRVGAGRAYLGAHRSLGAWFVLAGGLLFTGLLGALLLGVTGRSALVEGLVVARTDELARANAELCREVSQRKQAEDELRKSRDELEQRVRERTAELTRASDRIRESEARLRLFVERVPAAIALFDTDMRYLAVSRRWLSDYRLGDQDLLGRCHYDVFPEIPERWKVIHRRVLAGEVLRSDCDRFERADGSVQWLRWELHPWRRDDGTAGGIVLCTEDVTERRRMEESLRESEERLSLALQVAGMGTWDWDTATEKIVWTEQHYRILGYEPAPGGEAGFEMWRARIHPDDLPRVLDDLEEARRQRALFQREYRIIRADDGRVRWVQVAGRFLYDEDGNAVRMTGALVDVTERKAAEEAIRENERRTRELLEGLPQLVWTCLSSGECDYLSRQWCDYTGVPEAEQLGYGWSRAVHPDDADRLLRTWRASVESGNPLDVDFRIRAGDGSYCWFQTRALPLRDGAGRIVKWFGTNTDIEDKRRTEQQLRELNATLERRVAERTADLQRQTALLVAVLDNMAEGVTVADATGRITLVNPAGRAMVGLDHGDGGPETWPDYYGVFLPDGVTPFPAEQMPLALALRGQATQDVEMVLRNPSCPDERVIHVSGRPLVSPDETVHGGVVAYHDVTLRKRHKDQLAFANAELTRSNQELEQFAYVASHDLQEPLRMVASYLDLLAKRYKGRLDEKADKYIHYAVDGAARMQNLIQDLLTYSRVGRKEGLARRVDCGALVGRVLASFKAAVAERGADVTYEGLPVVSGEETQLTQLFQNLIGNALKFCDNEVPRVRISAERRDGGWLFAVRDNGIGIASEHRERVFVIFQRLHTRAQYPGTGIGLAICKKVVERHGGRIWVESEPGRGSTFYFTIPTKEDGHEQSRG